MTAISEAWQLLTSAHRVLRSLPASADDRQLWQIIDPAEVTIQSGIAANIDDVAIQLKVSLLHTLPNREDEAVVLWGDVKSLNECSADIDWNARLVLSALRSLEAMGA